MQNEQNEVVEMAIDKAYTEESLSVFKEFNLEMTSDFIKSIRRSANNGISIITSVLGGWKKLVTSIDSMDEDEVDARIVNSLPEKLDKTYKGLALSKINYGDVRNVRVMVPIGLDATYLDYMEVMRLYQEEVNRIETSTLTNFENLLGKIKNNMFDENNLSAMIRSAGVYLSDVDKLKAANSKVISRNKRSYQLYGKLVRRNNDLPMVIKEYKQLIKSHSAISRKNVSKKVNNCSKLIDNIIKELDELVLEKGNVDKDIRLLADLTLAVGVQVEIYAVHTYNLRVLGNSINDAILEIKKAK